MALLAQTQAQKFTPKAVKFSQMYKVGTEGGKVGISVLSKAKDTLAKAGYDEKKISQIITSDKQVSPAEMEKILGLMNKSGVYGFQKSPKFLVQEFLTKERIKAQNIARIRHEHIIEAGEEELTTSGTTSLNPQGRSPNAPDATVGIGKRPVRSLSSITNQTVSSLSPKAPKGMGAGSSPVTPAGGGVVTFKPKF